MTTVTQPPGTSTDRPLSPPDAVPYFWRPSSPMAGDRKRALPAPDWAAIDAWEAAHGLPAAA